MEEGTPSLFPCSSQYHPSDGLGVTAAVGSGLLSLALSEPALGLALRTLTAAASCSSCEV